MFSTVDWTDMSSEFQTESYSNEAMMTTSSSAETSMTRISLTPYKTATSVFGYLGILTNVLVLVGFWLCGRSKMNSSSVHIINHTALEHPTFPQLCPNFYNRHFLDLFCDLTYSVTS